MICGLEALDHMRDGQVLIDKSGAKYKMVDGILFKEIDKKDYLAIRDFDFCEEFEFFKEKLPTEWDKVECMETYYRIYTDGSIEGITFENDGYDKHLFNIGNYFNTREKAEEIEFEQELFRKLKRFSEENDYIDWTDINFKYYIKFDSGILKLGMTISERIQGTVYFGSEDTASKAIELFKDDLLKYFNYHAS